MLKTVRRLQIAVTLGLGILVVATAGGTDGAAVPHQAAARVNELLAIDLVGTKTDQKATVGSTDKEWKSGDDAYPSASTAKPAAAPAKAADDETFARRALMDLIGRPPSPAEVTAFVLDPAPDKREKLVDQLLAKPEFGENWGRYWRDVIMYRRTEDRTLLAAPALTQYLTEQFNKDTPWDQIARSFITASGDVRENGATGLIAAQFGQTPEVTSEVARIFMGIQIQCAQCHDHKTDRWKRTQFHELAASPRIAIRPVKLAGDKKQSFEVVGIDRPRPDKAKNANIPRGSQEHYMPDLSNPASKGTLMHPVFFLTGQKLPDGTSDAERRETIAKWITAKDDPWFAKAFVNRVWAELIGEGFYEPVDDMGPDHDCTAPKTMDYLANQFVAHQYDVKWLYRTVMATTAYQRDSRSRHLPGEMPFVANCPQRLRADELFNSLEAAIGIDDQRVAVAGGKKKYQPRDVRGVFNAVFGYDPSVRRDEVAGSIPQALVLMNSPQLARAMNGRLIDTSLGTLLNSTKDDTAVATELYLRSLAREPKPDEMKTCLEHVKQCSNRTEAFEDIQWALVNSTEFLHRK